MALLLAGCGAPAATATPAAATPRAQTPDTYIRIYGGLAGAYRTILEATDCGAIQELFYTASDNDSTGYQAAAMDRAGDLGCPELRFTRP